MACWNRVGPILSGMSTRVTTVCLLLPLLLWHANAQPAAQKTSYDHIGEAALLQKSDVAKLKKQADKGDLHSQVLLGIAYQYGYGTKQDDKNAAKWVSKAARAGEPVAEVILGRFYSAGIGVTEKKAEALKWFKQAADQGNAEAQFQLARAYQRGMGVPADESQANALYRKAAERGFGPAKCALVANDPKFRPGRGARPPSARYVPDAEYSEAARKARFGGTVELLLGVGEDGTVHEACVLRPLGLGLDEKALEAARRSKFDPTIKDGRTVPFALVVEKNFRLYPSE